MTDTTTSGIGTQKEITVTQKEKTLFPGPNFEEEPYHHSIWLDDGWICKAFIAVAILVGLFYLPEIFHFCLFLVGLVVLPFILFYKVTMFIFWCFGFEPTIPQQILIYGSMVAVVTYLWRMGCFRYDPELDERFSRAENSVLHEMRYQEQLRKNRHEELIRTINNRPYPWYWWS